uniref:calcium-binding protein n=1 Tax=Wohlfahrtiimonas populi TaxID=1940240 RepID=UPI00117FB081
DSIRIQNFFHHAYYQINEIHFADGNIVKQNEIQGLIDAQSDRSLVRTMSLVDDSSNISVNQELHSLISAMAAFDSSNSSNDELVVVGDNSLSSPLLSTPSY